MRSSLSSIVAALVATLMLFAPVAARAQADLSPVPLPEPALDARALKRAIRSWHDGEAIPFGYHAENRTRIGLVIPGAVLFGGSYALSLWAGSSGGGSYGAALYVPVFGPFIQMTNAPVVARDSCSSWFCPDYSDLRRSLYYVGLAIDGVVQVVGAAMLVAGIVGKRKLVGDEPGIVAVAPMYLSGGGAGLGVLARF